MLCCDYMIILMFPILDEPFLLASVQSELLLLGVYSRTLRLLSSANRPVFSLDYHWAQQRLYWLSPDYQSIRWTDMKNSNNKGTLIKGMTILGSWANVRLVHLTCIFTNEIKSCYRGEVRFHCSRLDW